MGCGSSSTAKSAAEGVPINTPDPPRDAAGLCAQIKDPEKCVEALSSLAALANEGKAKEVVDVGMNILIGALVKDDTAPVGRRLAAIKCLHAIVQTQEGPIEVNSRPGKALCDILREHTTEAHQDEDEHELVLEICVRCITAGDKARDDFVNLGIIEAVSPILRGTQKASSKKILLALTFLQTAVSYEEGAKTAVSADILKDICHWLETPELMGSDQQLAALHVVKNLTEHLTSDFKSFKDSGVFSALGHLIHKDADEDDGLLGTVQMKRQGNNKRLTRSRSMQPRLQTMQQNVLQALAGIAHNPEAEMSFVEEGILGGLLNVASDESQYLTGCQLEALKVLNTLASHLDNKPLCPTDLRVHFVMSGGVNLILTILTSKADLQDDLKAESLSILKYVADNPSTATAFLHKEVVTSILTMFKDETLPENSRHSALFVLMCLSTWSNPFHCKYSRVLRQSLMTCGVGPAIYPYVSKPGRFMQLGCFSIIHLYGCSEDPQHMEMVSRCGAAVGAVIMLTTSALDKKGPVANRQDVLAHVAAKLASMSKFDEVHRHQFIVLGVLQLIERVLRERIPEAPLETWCTAALHIIADPSAADWVREHSSDTSENSLKLLLKSFLSKPEFTLKEKRECAILCNALGEYADVPDLDDCKSSGRDSSNLSHDRHRPVLAKSHATYPASVESGNVMLQSCSSSNFPDPDTSVHLGETVSMEISDSAMSSVTTQKYPISKAGSHRTTELAIPKSTSNGFLRTPTTLPQKPVELKGGLKYHAFLTHDWGIDELGRDNHQRVSRLNEYLKSKGLITWFDADRMVGNIVDQMVAGIDESACVIVCITERYVGKVRGTDLADNCKKEFHYAEQRKTAQFMIPVVMERRMMNPRQWAGGVGMVLGGLLYQHLYDDDEFDAHSELIYKEVNSLAELAVANVSD